MTDRKWETALAKARAFGVESGKAAGSWMLDGNSTVADAQKLLDGWEDGDPEVMDLEPSPLSGEWADSITASDVYAAADMDEDETEEAASEILSAFEEGYSEGFWDEVCRAARAMGAVR